MKTGKKIIGMLLVVIMLVSFVPFDTNKAYAKSKSKDKDITELVVGDKSNGFTLTAISNDRPFDEKIYIFEHDKTGAEVYFVKNDDIEKTFSIYFNTYPENEKGIPHIIEHSVITSTEKYKGRDVFFALCDSGYITEANAYTDQIMTFYPISSLDEQELLSYSDLFLDGVFNGDIRKDDRIFKSEAFRYILEDKDAPLEVNGVVYNEMIGSYSNISRYKIDALRKALFRNNYDSYDSGGQPTSILDLTYEELVDFYDKYYHPSNCRVLLYGNLDYVKWLKKLNDEYFSKYDRKEFTAPDKPVPCGDCGTVYVDFPAEEDTEDLSGEMVYAWDLSDNLKPWEIEALDNIGMFEISQGTAFRDELDASGIALNYTSGVQILGDQCLLIVSAINADTTRAEEFKNIVDKHFGKVSKKNLNKDLLNAFFESSELGTELSRNVSHCGMNFATNFCSYISTFGKYVYLYADEFDEKVKELVTSGKVVKLFRNNVVKNNNKVLVVVTPKPGLAEENEKAIEQKLIDLKASLSDDEIEALIESTKEFDEWNVTETPQETIDKLVSAKSSTIEITEPEYEAFVKEVDGVKVYAAITDSKAAFYNIYFDISNFSKKELKALNEYLSLMGALSTKNRDIEQIIYEATNYLSGLKCEMVGKTVNDKEIPMLQISFYALPENLDNALDLVLDMFYNTDLEANAELVYMYMSYFQSQYYDAEALFDTFYLDATANSTYSDRLSWELHGIPSYLYLTKTVSSEKNFANFIKYVEKARKQTAKRQNGIISIIAPKEMLEEGIEKLLSAYPSKNKAYKEGSALKLAAIPKKVGVIMNTASSYLFLGASSKDDFKTLAARKLLSVLIESNVYFPKFRYEMGTYTPMCTASVNGFFISMLYRSPSPIEQYEIMLQMPEYVLQMLDYVTEEDIEGYKLSLIPLYICPDGDFNMTNAYLKALQYGYDRNPNYIMAENIKNLTVEDLKEAAKDLNKFYEEGNLLVCGSSSEIKAHKDLFDKIYTIK